MAPKPQRRATLKGAPPPPPPLEEPGSQPFLPPRASVNGSATDSESLRSNSEETVREQKRCVVRLRLPAGTSAFAATAEKTIYHTLRDQLKSKMVDIATHGIYHADTYKPVELLKTMESIHGKELLVCPLGGLFLINISLGRQIRKTCLLDGTAPELYLKVSQLTGMPVSDLDLQFSDGSKPVKLDSSLEKYAKKPKDDARLIKVKVLLKKQDEELLSEERDSFGQLVTAFHKGVSRAGSEEELDFMDFLADTDLRQPPKIKRLHVLQELIETERSYLNSVRQCMEFYMRPMVAQKVITKAQSNSLFSNMEALLGINEALLRDILSRVPESNLGDTQIGDLFLAFAPYLKMYKVYFSTHAEAQNQLAGMVSMNDQLAQFLKERGTFGVPTMDSLLLMPIQRVPRYSLMLQQMLRATGEDHADLHALEAAVTEIGGLTKDLNESVKKIENQVKLMEIERGFPSDVLSLLDTMNVGTVRVYNNRRSTMTPNDSLSSADLAELVNGKRGQSPSLKRRLFGGGNSATNGTRSSGRGSVHSGMGVVEEGQVNGQQRIMRNIGNPFDVNEASRWFVIEGPAMEAVTGDFKQRQRHLFLFSDLLVVANRKGQLANGKPSYRLQSWMPLHELWVADEAVQLDQKSLVVGWPGSEFTFTFENKTEKQIWVAKLKEWVTKAKGDNYTKGLVKVFGDLLIPPNLLGKGDMVDNMSSCDDLIKKVAPKLLGKKTGVDFKSYCLWAMIPGPQSKLKRLNNYECPLLLTQFWERLHSEMVSLSGDALLDPALVPTPGAATDTATRKRAVLYLRHVADVRDVDPENVRAAAMQNPDDIIAAIGESAAADRVNNATKSGAELGGSLKVGNKGSQQVPSGPATVGRGGTIRGKLANLFVKDSSNSTADPSKLLRGNSSLLEAEEASDGLFGLPLPKVCVDGKPPKPIYDMLDTLWDNAPGCQGVFRRSANARVVRELSEKMDAGETEISFRDENVLAVGAALKSYLRSIPDSLFNTVNYRKFIDTNAIAGDDQRVVELSNLLAKLPDENRLLIRLIVHVLKHVAAKHESNLMDASNLGICVGPSMIWSQDAMDMARNDVAPLIEFMIDCADQLFPDFTREELILVGEPETDPESDATNTTAGVEVKGEDAPNQVGTPLIEIPEDAEF
eukprot:Clim_evm8s52 gene=Clim_evmTU8s52